MSNNDWAVQQGGGSEESRENNVIYIGRASFRMEPASVTAEEIIAPPHVVQVAMQDTSLDVQHGASHLSGEDIEPPYLRLRTLVDESQVQDLGNQHTPLLDLTEFATIAENTGVEIVRHDAPTLPRTLIADVASFPHAMPTGIEPGTEVVVSAKAMSFSRSRLVGWGSAAFCAGLLASAAAHMLMAPAHLGPIANAATVSTKDNAAPQVASPGTSATAPAPSPAASAQVALTAPAAPVAEAPAPVPATTELARADAPNLAAPALLPASVRTRSGAAAQARSQTRARGRLRSPARSSSTAAAVDTPSDEPAADSSDDAPAARPAAQHAAGWVDPFAQ